MTESKAIQANSQPHNQNSSGRAGSQFIKTFTNAEKEA